MKYKFKVGDYVVSRTPTIVCDKYIDVVGVVIKVFPKNIHIKYPNGGTQVAYVEEDGMELVTTGASVVRKFKVGDKVRVTGNTSYHRFDIGDVVTVVRVHEGDYECNGVGSQAWYLTDEEVELATTQDTPKAFDPVSKPSHYNQYGIEAIDAIRASLGPVGFQAYCKGNVIKYLWRYEYKNGLEDLKKAQVYLNWMVESKGATE